MSKSHHLIIGLHVRRTNEGITIGMTWCFDHDNDQRATQNSHLFENESTNKKKRKKTKGDMNIAECIDFDSDNESNSDIDVDSQFYDLLWSKIKSILAERPVEQLIIIKSNGRQTVDGPFADTNRFAKLLTDSASRNNSYTFLNILSVIHVYNKHDKCTTELSWRDFKLDSIHFRAVKLATNMSINIDGLQGLDSLTDLMAPLIRYPKTATRQVGLWPVVLARKITHLSSKWVDYGLVSTF